MINLPITNGHDCNNDSKLSRFLLINFLFFVIIEIRSIINNQVLYEKYEDFMVRRVLAVDPDTRWCPAPDCG